MLKKYEFTERFKRENKKYFILEPSHLSISDYNKMVRKNNKLRLVNV